MTAVFAHGRQLIRRLALVLFGLYLAVFPGSTITVALDRVPAWGEWMGGALLLIQGAIVLCWLVGGYGRRGALAAALIFLLAWGVEHLGVTTGFPFGRYRYTAQLQPQLLGAVPLAIPCAWLMVVVGAWQIADCRLQIADLSVVSSPLSVAGRRSQVAGRRGHASRITHHASRTSLLAATLVLLLDMQIEPVATAINRYWVWLDGGAYYGVPAANFAAWWVVGLVMAVVVGRMLGRSDRRPPTADRRPPDGARHNPRTTFYVLRFTFYALPACLYLLNTLMFAAINLARGYVVAGMVGVAVLIASMLAIALSSAKRTASRRM
jgi:putative membrane protein